MVFSLALLVVATASLASAHEECGVYLAPSTIPGAGMGMYAGNVDYHKGDKVTFGDVVAPVYELEWNNDDEHIDFLWDEYFWNHDDFAGMDRESEDGDLVHVASPGVGSAMNSIVPLANVGEDHDEFRVDLAGVPSSQPGAGAFSPYHNRLFTAKSTIRAGAELFVNYGYNYFKTRPNTYGYLPLEENYSEADRLLSTYHQMTRKVSTQLVGASHKSDELAHDLWNLLRDQPEIWARRSRTLNALPQNESLVEPVLNSGGTSKMFHNQTFRDLSWLEQHGTCMDHIRNGPSNNPQAGRGALANRNLKEGQVIAPVPLIHIPQRDTMLIREPYIHPDTNNLRPDMDKPIHSQLLLNYCFGHVQSTLLLCSYGLLTWLVNHNHKRPNAKIVWSPEMRHKEWLDQPLDQWSKTEHAGLSFDLVALKDIPEGDEIVIDYGHDWEQSWQEHVKGWDYTRRVHYRPAFELNQDDDLIVRTSSEPSPYESEGVDVYCHVHYLEVFGLTDNISTNHEKDDREGMACRVTHRSADNLRYSVELLKFKENEDEEIITESVVGYVVGLPRDAIYFEDSHYDRDHQQRWAFRHAVMVPDDIFPDVWKNAKETIKWPVFKK